MSMTRNVRQKTKKQATQRLPIRFRNTDLTQNCITKFAETRATRMLTLKHKKQREEKRVAGELHYRAAAAVAHGAVVSSDERAARGLNVVGCQLFHVECGHNLAGAICTHHESTHGKSTMGGRGYRTRGLPYAAYSLPTTRPLAHCPLAPIADWD